MKKTKTLFPVLLLAAFPACNDNALAGHSHDSQYNHVIVTDQGGIVAFQRVEGSAVVSAIDRSSPARQVLPYTGVLFSPLFFKPDPEAVLSVGLGAGAINRLMPIAAPTAKLVTVEIDPMMVDLAARYTGYEQTERDRVVIEDARRYLAREETRWDWIVQDAFVKKSLVPPHLTTVEFYRLVASRLADDGVMVVNLQPGSGLFASHFLTLREAFAQTLVFRPDEGGDVVALCVTYREPDLRHVLERVDLTGLPDLRAYDVDLAAMRRSAVPADDPLLHPADGQLLTDDHAPVEFLSTRPAKAK